MGLFGAVFSFLPFVRARRDKRRDENPDRRRRGERAALLVKPDAATTTTEGWVLRVVTLALVLACGVVWASFASGVARAVDRGARGGRRRGIGGGRGRRGVDGDALARRAGGLADGTGRNEFGVVLIECIGVAKR